MSRGGATANACPAPDRKAGEADREAVFILGMHRSGTSFLAETVARLGFALPADRSTAAPDNPRGHFEPRRIVALNEDLLDRMGGGWCRLSPVTGPVSRIEPEFARPADAALAACYGAERRIVVKDPRIALLAATWQRYARAAGIRQRFVVALRDPEAVAASLARRDGLPTDLSLLLWCHYTLAAFSATARRKSAVFLFPDWMRDSEAEMARLRAHLSVSGRPGKNSPNPQRWFLAGSVHGAPAVSRCRDPRIAALAQAIFLRASACARGGARLTRTEMDGFWRQYLDLTEDRRALETRAGSRLAKLRLDLEQAEDRVGRREARARHLERQLLATEAQRDAIAKVAHDHLAGAEALGRRIEATERQRDMIALAHDQAVRDAWGLLRSIAATELQRDHFAKISRSHHAAATALQDTVRATEAQRDTLKAMLDARIQDAADLQRQVAATEDQRGWYAAAHDRSHADATALQGQVAATEAQRDTLGACLEECRAEAAVLRARLRAAEEERDALASQPTEGPACDANDAEVGRSAACADEAPAASRPAASISAAPEREHEPLQGSDEG